MKKVTIEVEEPQVPEETLRREARKVLARKWRRQGHTFQAIATALHVSIRTAWMFCRDVPRGRIHEVQKVSR